VNPDPATASEFLTACVAAEAVTAVSVADFEALAMCPRSDRYAGIAMASGRPVIHWYRRDDQIKGVAKKMAWRLNL